MLSSVTVNLGGSAVVQRKGPKVSNGGMQRRFHRSLTTLHDLGDLLDGKVRVVAEHDGQTLAGRQLTKCGHDRHVRGNTWCMVSTRRFRWMHRRRTITAALLSPSLSYRDDKDPSRRSIKPRYGVPLSEGSGECLLGGVLRIEAAAHPEPQGAADTGILSLKELLEGFVRRSRHHLTGDRGTTRSKRLVETKYRAVPEPRGEPIILRLDSFKRNCLRSLRWPIALVEWEPPSFLPDNDSR